MAKRDLLQLLIAFKNSLGQFKPKVLAVVSALALGPTCQLYGASVNDLTWTIANEEVTITGNTLGFSVEGQPDSGELVIPDTIDGFPVTSIGANAFLRTSLASITIPDSVTNIGFRAFAALGNPTQLTSITFGEGSNLTTIGDSAFANLSSLTNITIPDTVTSIGVDGFRDCASLTSITIPDGITSIERSVFFGCQGLTSITIPASVTSIDDYAFGECTSLTSITFLGTPPTVAANTFLYNVSVPVEALVTSENQNLFGDIGTTWNGLTIALAPLATGYTVTFTGGTATIANGPPVITDGQALYGNVVKYQEGDVVVTFLSPGEDWTGQSIGNYYDGSDDVIHAHWDDISGIEIQRLDDVPFDLQFFHLTSNTESGGGLATGNETIVIQGWLNGIAVTEEFQLPSDDWGGSYQDVVLPASFDNVDKVVIRDISQWVNGEYVGGNYSAFCFGMDNFVFDDVVPQELLTGNTVELVVVDSTPPNAPTLTGPALTKSTTPTLTGTAEPGSTVEIYDGVNSLGSVQAESGVYSITVSSLLEGSHNITATATDEAGNVSAASLALTVVVDTTAPVITLSGSANTEVQAGSSYIDAGASADGQEDVSSQGEVDTTQLGSYTINYTAQDLAGNVGTATRTVNVVDTTSPVITLNGGGSGGEVTIEVGGTYQELGATLSDNYDTSLSLSSSTSYVINNSAVNTSVVGEYTVTYNVTDSNSNVAQQVTRTVNVVDTTLPVIALIGNAVVTIEVGESYTELGATVSDNYDTGLSATIDSSDVDTSVVGEYTVTYNVTDGNSNVAQQVTRTVNVVDTTIPVISLTGDAVVTIEVGTPYQDQGVTVSDNYDTNLTVTINSSDVDTSVLGSYDVIYSATDSSENQAVQVTRTVIVEDTTPPVITLNGDAGVTIEMGSTYTELGATVSDNYDTGLSATPTGSVDTSKEGLYTINYSATDDSGNTGTAERTVIVDDTTPPTSPGLVGPSLTNSPTPTLDGVAEFGSTVRIYDGANLLGSVGVDENESYSFQVPSLEDGSYDITATATDGAGNVSAGSPVITVVVDTTAPDAPTLTGPSLTKSTTPTLTGTAEAGSTVKIYDGGNLLGSAQANGSGSFGFIASVPAEGSHGITATATDGAGNESGSSPIITVVVDTTAPDAPTLTGPSLTKNPEPTLTGTAEPGSTVLIYDGVNLLGEVGVDVNESYSFQVPSLEDGSHNITATATDEAGNVSAGTMLAVIVDTTAPVITLSGSANTEVQAGSSYIDAGASADGQEDVSSQGEVDTTQLGSYTINYTAQDLAENVGTATRTVNVVDTTSPVITLNGGGSGGEVTIEVGGTYQELGATLSDNYDSPSSLGSSDLYVVDSSEVNTEVLGEYLVTYNVTDSQGNVAQQVTRTVKVVDTTSPVITLNGGGSGGEVTIPLGGSYTELGATVSDNYDTELAVTIDSSAVDDTSVVGSYLVTYNVTDDSGNTGTTTREVNVVDITLPVVTLNGGDVTIEMGESYTELGATATDNYYTTGLDVTLSGTVVTSAVGTYTINYSATDGSNNTGTATRTVTVVDTTAPVITVYPGADMVAMGIPWIDAGAISDGGETISVSGSVDINTIGIYTVTYSAFDGFNTGTATRTVTVQSPNDSFGDVVIYPNNSATLIGQVTIEGEAAESGDVVGVFVDGELRGKQEVIVFEGTAWVNMLVNSAGGNETISFKVFDSSTGVTHEKTKSSAVIESGGFVGTPENPFMIEMKDFEIQTLSLSAGWNLVSFYVEDDDMSPETVLSPIQDKLVQIKNGSYVYDPSVASLFNTLTSLNVKDGYWLEVSEDVSFEVEGRVSSGVSTTVNSGWNLVGYPRMNGEAVADELVSLGDTVVEIKDLASSYNPSLPSFLNTLSTLAPGSGYWLKVSQGGTWELGDGGLSFASFKTGFGNSAGEKNGPAWHEPVVYPNVGATVLAQVSVQGEPVGAGSVVGVFVGNELRGQQNVVLHEGNSYVTLNVNLSDTEEVSYRVWNSNNKNEYLVSGTMQLELGETYGNPELVELDAVEVVNKSLDIFNVTSEPFGFSVNTMVGKNYTVEATGDLRTWEAVESFEGSGGEIRYTAPASSGKRQFFRVYVE